MVLSRCASNVYLNVYGCFLASSSYFYLGLSITTTIRHTITIINPLTVTNNTITVHAYSKNTRDKNVGISISLMPLMT